MTLRPTEEARLRRLHRFETEGWANGYRLIAGIDEVGRGPLAGPVTAACVIAREPLMLAGLNDSKRVSERRRIALDVAIRAHAVAVGIGSASVGEIEATSIADATRLAMERALAAAGTAPDLVLVDAMRLPNVVYEQRAIIDGDALSAVIAAASIVAKVHRDAELTALDLEFPQYGFAKHKGYGTAAHLAALREHGPSRHHRRSFAPVRALLPS